MKEKDTLHTNGITPLHIASVKGNIEEVQGLLSQGIDINAKDKDGYTPLHYACAVNSLEIVKCLIEAGADVNAKSNCGALPLDWASKGNNVAKLKYLIEKKEGGRTEEEYIDIIKYLLERKSDWSVLIDNIEDMSLVVARQIEEENEDIIRLLLLKCEKVITQNVHNFIIS
ncbi:MAG: ankyrin repeat domain-containing protein [Candidatus Amoebophilus sp.]